MSDIFREVDEDLRREQVKRLWDRFAPYVLGLAVLIVAATAGYRGWEYWREHQAQTTGDQFLAALDLANAGKHAEAITALEAVEKNGSGGYPVLARFRLASEKALTGDKAGAVAEFDQIAADGAASADVKNLARLRAALLLVDTSSLSDLQARVGDLATTGNPWRHMAREVLGLAAWRTGDYVSARKYFTDIDNDQDASDDAHQRAKLMLTLIDSRLGVVAPPPATAAAPPAPATPAVEAPATP